MTYRVKKITSDFQTVSDAYEILKGGRCMYCIKCRKEVTVFATIDTLHCEDWFQSHRSAELVTKLLFMPLLPIVQPLVTWQTDRRPHSSLSTTVGDRTADHQHGAGATNQRLQSFWTSIFEATQQKSLFKF